jgi:Xaa-Pro aminopeptidase
MNNRIAQLQKALAERSLDAVLITHIPHVRYLSGFSGSAAHMFITRKKATFLTDFRYEQQAAQELAPGIDAVVDRAPMQRLLNDGFIKAGTTLGFQDAYLSVATFDALKKKLKKVKLERTGSLVADLTMAKTEEEIGYIRKAANIAAKVYTEVLNIAKPGMRENELAMEISYLGKKFGSEGDAFDIIVASGARGALPHGRASTKKLKKGEMVTLDFGCIYNGFNSDMTRTFAIGTPSAEARKIYDIVYEAEQMGVKSARPGMTAKQLDDVCRDHIAAAGFGEEFGHSTGHGLGIEVHEAPAVSFRDTGTELKENMVVTIEPGIYLPGKCGVRIEDDVAITAKGCKVLTSSPRELITL